MADQGCVAPLAGPAVGVAAPALEETFKNNFALMEKLAEKLPELQQADDLALAEEFREPQSPNRTDGPELRSLYELLRDKDPSRHWGGVRKIHTPEGHYLWLCEQHAAEYPR